MLIESWEWCVITKQIINLAGTYLLKYTKEGHSFFKAPGPPIPPSIFKNFKRPVNLLISQVKTKIHHPISRREGQSRSSPFFVAIFWDAIWNTYFVNDYKGMFCIWYSHVILMCIIVCKITFCIFICILMCIPLQYSIFCK